jgi:hypothetical protein
MKALQTRLDSALGPGHTRVDATTGSVLVRYDRHAHKAGEIVAMLRDAGILLQETARGVGLEVPEFDGYSTAGDRVVDTVGDLDRQIAALTGRKVDLKFLFPMLLGGIGLWRAVSSGLGVTEVPAYVLLWYAFDSFWKFHREAGVSEAPRSPSQGGHPNSGEA